MPVKTVLLILSIIVVTACGQKSGVAGFEEAKARAAKQEPQLESYDRHMLNMIRDRAVDRAISACMPTPLPNDTPSFAVVLELDSVAGVKNTWLSSESELARCIELELVKIFTFLPPTVPFYTELEFKFE